MPERLSVSPIGHTTGFDYLRVLLAVAVVLSHTILSSYGVDAQARASSFLPIGIPQRLILPMFFSLSGYLVAGSLFRCRTLITFVGLRVIRIVPALACEVLLSALLLGPLVTGLTLHDYVTDQRFFQYFLNIVGDIHYVLPGVFTHNPYPNVVNVQLWTIPWELNCYLALTILTLLGFINKSRIHLMILVASQAVLLAYVGYKLSMHVAPPRGASGPVLFVAFLAGLNIFIFKDVIRFSGRLALLAAIACVVIETIPFGNYAVAIPCAYLTVWLGRLNPKKVFPIDRGDYSYGIYLYGLPIQQAAANLGPAFQHWYVSLATLPLIVGVSVASWHLVEKPALAVRPTLKAIEERWLRARSSVRRMTGLRPLPSTLSEKS